MDGKVTLLLRPDAPRPIIALVAHDRRKDEMVEWAHFNRGTLSRCTCWWQFQQVLPVGTFE